MAKPKFTIIAVWHIWKMYPVNLHSPETTQHSTTIHTAARPRLITLQCSYSSSKTTLLSLLPLSAFTLWGRNKTRWCCSSPVSTETGEDCWTGAVVWHSGSPVDSDKALKIHTSRSQYHGTSLQGRKCYSLPSYMFAAIWQRQTVFSLCITCHVISQMWC